MSRTAHFTALDLAAMPDDGKRYEVIAGQLFVSPAAAGRHQPVVTRVMSALLRYLEEAGVRDQVLTAPADVTLAVDTLVQPDVLVADTTAFLRSGNWIDVTTLFLVVEIVSPSSRRTDRTLKRAAYQRYGVPCYWVVDSDARQVEVWTPGAADAVVERDRLVWRHPDVAELCVIDLQALFAFP